MAGTGTARRSATPWFLAVPPEPRQAWIGRQRLSDTLEREALTHAAVLLEVPSGFGKTIALSAWAAARTAPTAWLTATAHDADAAQLLSGVLTALIRIHPDNTALTELLGRHYDGELPASQAVLALVEIFIDALPRTTLIIDDAHLSSREAFESVVLPIIQFGRGHLTLVIAGTRDLRTWCARPLAHGEASHIDPAALAFTPDEVAQAQARAQVQPLTGTPPEDEWDPEQLWAETQGWPVAVLLALQGSAPHSIEPSDRHEVVADYIETAVLDGLRDDLRDFVLATTTCNRLTGALAEELSGRADAPELLEECRRIGLFLDRYTLSGSAATVYRWHSTFARNCRDIHSRRDPARYLRAHRAAAEWMSGRFPAEAVQHALAAADPGFAVAIVEDNWLQMICGGQAGLLAAACAQIPEPWHEEPAFLMIRACCRDVTGERLGAELLADRGRAALDRADGEQQVRGYRAAAFAELFLLHDQTGLQAAAERAHEMLSAAPFSVGQLLYGRFLVGWTEMRLRRDPSRAIGLLTTVATSAREAGHAVLAGRAAANLSFALALGGRFGEAQAMLDTLSNEEGLAEWEYYDGGIEVMSAILIAHWRGDQEAVIDLARKLHARNSHGGSYAALARVHFAFAVAALRTPSLYGDAANMLLGVSEHEQHGVPWPVYRSIGTAQLAMARSDHAAALEALSEITDWRSIPTTLVLAAELYRKLGHHEQAVEMLRGITRAEMVSYVYASAQFTKAALAWARGDHAVAHQALERSIKVAASEGITLPFANLDDVSREMLTRHSAWGTSFEGFVAARLAVGSSGVNRSDVISAPLSAREREVFGYLSTTMTAEEIAAALHVSVNTVRSHQRAIYRKLGVGTRREAIRVHI